MDYEGELTVSEGDSGCCSSDGQFRRRSSTITGLAASTGFLTSPPTTTVGVGGLRPPRRKRRPSYNKAVSSLGGSPVVGNLETTSAESLQILPCSREEDTCDEKNQPLGGSGPLSGQTRSTTAAAEFYGRIAANDPATAHVSLPTLYNRNV